ncbi:helix-turn-helix domain-containing protein [Umezawaea sp. Da 62-37]|uniref:TetR/AcrR family transcriptional regulator n=1 Tax=Umezawaea sp. Da 62-37 TaxID=3075927 RepID=UPI0028F6E7E4|nr:helix-turn-helix domain-containing protein [Umezawaea sp. Da 62-37]WNV85727.1 helix-turn-helix domain-containing protein [Umezawaea sp. Da 62-37]
MNTTRLDEVLDATYDCLVRFGVKRTTMDDIAQAAGMSRSAVYQYVRNKDDAVRRLAVRLHDAATERAVAAAAADLPTAQRVHDVLRAKLDLVLALAGDSPHTAELLDAKARLYGDVCTTFTHRVTDLLVDLLTEAGAGGLAPADAAQILVALVVGMEADPNASRLLGPAVDLLLSGLPAAGGS